MTRGRLARCAAALLLLAAAVPGCGSPDRGSVRVLVPWTSEDELGPFKEVIERFRATPAGRGVDVRPVPTRATRQSLETAFRNGDPPDLAIVPTPGVLRDYVRQGRVQPLDDILGPELQRQQYGSTWLGFGRVGTDKQYAVVVKANVKSLIWYNKRAFGSPTPSTWNGLLDVTGRIAGEKATPWCMAMADPPNSGWPGTDWIEDILLHQSGPDDYARLAEGTLPWTSAPVRNAWRTWRALLSDDRIRGGRLSALLLPYGQSHAPLFASPPGCRLAHGATLVPASPPAPQPEPGVDADFFPFPAFEGSEGQSFEVSADLLALFRSSPQAKAFVEFLASAPAQEVWPAEAEDSAFTPHLAVLRGRLADRSASPVGGRIARLLVSGRPLCFDASDWMPDTMANAFYRAVLDYLHDPSSDARLETILSRLDTVRKSAYPAGSVRAGSVCGPAPREPGAATPQ